MALRDRERGTRTGLHSLWLICQYGNSGHLYLKKNTTSTIQTFLLVNNTFIYVFRVAIASKNHKYQLLLFHCETTTKAKGQLWLEMIIVHKGAGLSFRTVNTFLGD